MALHSYIRRPRAATSPLTALQVAKAYNYPTGATGKGFTGGIIELGGGFSPSDLLDYFTKLGLPIPSVTSVEVDGGKNQSDGPNGADGEVLLDIEVMGSVAPGAAIRVYFCPNTDTGFLAGIKQAAKECDAISISWGGPEDGWAVSSMTQFDDAFATARAAGVNVFVAAGDSGSGDGESGTHVDFPSSSPNVVGCGGTRLTINADGSRSTETVWDDSDTSSATGGGVSTMFPGRDVPDVAGNADPDTGYEVIVDGGSYVIGGTSAVAPLYAGLCLRLKEASNGAKFDFLKVLTANPTTCFDVTSGDNGAFRAGPGRDETTGFGVVDGTKFLTAIVGATPTPPVSPTPPVNPTPPVTPTPPSTIPGPVLTFFNSVPAGWENERHVGDNEKVAKAVQVLRTAFGQGK